MNRTLLVALPTILIIATAFWLSGCSDKSGKPAPGSDATAPAGQAHEDHDSHAHEDQDSHAEAPLTENDVELPSSFTKGIDRLEALHHEIEQEIEANQLSKVHRTAEELALVAKRMKQLARNEIDEQKQADVGRLCNQLAALFPTIDEVADAGEKAETKQFSAEIEGIIGKLRDLARAK